MHAQNCWEEQNPVDSHCCLTCTQVAGAMQQLLGSCVHWQVVQIWLQKCSWGHTPETDPLQKGKMPKSLRGWFLETLLQNRKSVLLTLRLTAKVQRKLLKGDVPFPPLATPNWV